MGFQRERTRGTRVPTSFHIITFDSFGALALNFGENNEWYNLIRIYNSQKAFLAKTCAIRVPKVPNV